MKILKSATKLYEVTFREYTNWTKNTISDGKGLQSDYIEVDNGSLIIADYEFEYYKQFGGGFNTIRFIGFRYEDK